MFENDQFNTIDISDPYYAEYQRKLLIEYVKDFQDTLDSSHEVGIFLANYGCQKAMIVTDIGFANPMLVIFYGFVDGVDSVLIQHISQINFLLTSVEKPDPTKPPRRIGFTFSPDGDD